MIIKVIRETQTHDEIFVTLGVVGNSVGGWWSVSTDGRLGGHSCSIQNPRSAAPRSPVPR